jgi:hydrogenase-4 component F
MILALLGIPLGASILLLLIRNNQVRRISVILVALAHLVVTISAWFTRPVPIFHGWLKLDALGILFLTITSVLFLAASCYAFGYLRAEEKGLRKDFEPDVFFTNTPEAVFCACLLVFLTSMTLVITSHHLGLLWVAIEATTLSTARLIYFHRHHRSLEATWKYLLICSVGIAIALLGNFFMAISVSGTGSEENSLVLADLIRQGPHLNIPWLRVAFLFLLVGYGTKMGLAPLHTWLPDAHSESPSVVSALLSGSLLNCAFLAILRVYQVCLSAGLATFCRDLFVVFGLLSLIWAAVFILNQIDYKRMLAYSSVEHIGILALGVGIGKTAVFGSLLHAVNHSFAKALLFLVAGNILARYQTKEIKNIRGLIHVIPVSGVLWLAGFLAIVGMPPFGLFISEFTIAKSIFEQDKIIIGIVFLAVLSLVFVGMSRYCLNMAVGRAPETLSAAHAPEKITMLLPPALLAVLVLILGIYIPPCIQCLLTEAAGSIGGGL